MRISESTHLSVDREQAWSYLIDWERQSDWMKDASWVRVTSSSRTGVGTTIAVKTLIFGVPAFTEPIEVTAWEPPSRLGIRHGGPVAGQGSWTLEETADGCRFTWTEEVAVRVPLVGELVARVYARFMRGLMRHSLASLKLRVEP